MREDEESNFQVMKQVPCLRHRRQGTSGVIMKKSFVLLAGFLTVQGSVLAAGGSVEKIIDVMRSDHVYAALPLLDDEISKAGPDVIDFIGLAVKTELMLSRSEGMSVDHLLLCNLLKKANKSGGVSLPEKLSTKNSITLQGDICGMFDRLSGEQVFDMGMKVLSRTESGIFSPYTIKHAVPYFLLSEKKGFRDEELYSILAMVYAESKNYAGAYDYAKKFFLTGNQKGMDAGRVQRILSISRFVLVKQPTHDDIDELRDGLEKARRMGDKKSVDLLSSLKEMAAKTNSRMMAVRDCSVVVRNDALYGYCTRGDCNGFARDFGVWNLCANDDFTGLSKNQSVWFYLNSGDASGFAKDFGVWIQAQKSAASFADRKRFIIYYLHGHVYGN